MGLFGIGRRKKIQRIQADLTRKTQERTEAEYESQETMLRLQRTMGAASAIMMSDLESALLYAGSDDARHELLLSYAQKAQTDSQYGLVAVKYLCAGPNKYWSVEQPHFDAIVAHALSIRSEDLVLVATAMRNRNLSPQFFPLIAQRVLELRTMRRPDSVGRELAQNIMNAYHDTYLSKLTATNVTSSTRVALNQTESLLLVAYGYGMVSQQSAAQLLPQVRTHVLRLLYDGGFDKVGAKLPDRKAVHLPTIPTMLGMIDPVFAAE